MLFNFFMSMHNAIGKRSLEDVVGIMGNQLRALGHEAILDSRNLQEDIGQHVYVTHPNSINVLVEGFTPGWVEHLSQARAAGIRFLILATEEPTERGFNHGTQKEMVARQKIFPEAAKLCEGILHLVPGEHVTRWYGQFVPSAQAELGFAPGLLRVTNQEPDFDFGFFGSLTTRRHRILKRLAKMVGTQKAVFIESKFPAQDVRDAMVRRCKVIVQLRKFEAMGLVSSSRCNTALMVGRPVVPEPHTLTHPWDEVIRFPQTMDGFYRNALLARSAWRQVWNDQVDKFRRKLSPEFCVGEPLRRIGIVTNEGGRAAA